MYQVMKTIMKCSKCKSMNIVAPCNEDAIDFRCMNCGHVKLSETRVLPGTIDTTNWTYADTDEDYEVFI